MRPGLDEATARLVTTPNQSHSSKAFFLVVVGTRQTTKTLSLWDYGRDIVPQLFTSLALYLPDEDQTSFEQAAAINTVVISSHESSLH